MASVLHSVLVTVDHLAGKCFNQIGRIVATSRTALCRSGHGTSRFSILALLPTRDAPAETGRTPPQHPFGPGRLRKTLTASPRHGDCFLLSRRPQPVMSAQPTKGRLPP